MDVSALQAACDKLAANISRHADMQNLQLPEVTSLLNAASEFLRVSRPARLQNFTIGDPTVLSTHLVPSLASKHVCMVVVHEDETSFIVPVLNWSWNTALGKITLINGYTFPEGSTVDLYYSE